VGKELDDLVSGHGFYLNDRCLGEHHASRPYRLLKLQGAARND
jgi:hypothetical protein